MDSRKFYVRSIRFNCPQNPNSVYVQQMLGIVALFEPVDNEGSR